MVIEGESKVTGTTKTAAEYNAEAAQHDQNAADSFERCDTDGFLSQWASGINAQVARANAKIAEAGGIATFSRLRLVTLDGQETDARKVRTKYGTKWRLDSADQWLAYEPARESTLAKHGYKEIEELIVAPAKARSWAPDSARGMSGATSVQVIVFRDDVRVGIQMQWNFAGYGDQS